MRVEAMRVRTILSALALLALLLACGFGGGRPAWANFKIVIKDKDGDELDESPYYCISAPREGRVYRCAQPNGHVEEIEIEPGWKVQVWTLPKPMP